MKKYNLFKVVGIAFLAVCLLTWFIPGTAFDGYEFTQSEATRTGLWNFMSYPLESAHYFINMLIFVVMVGGFYGVLNKLDAYHKMLKKLATKFKSNGMYVLVAIMMIFALLSAIAGLNFELFILLPFVVSLVLLLGYDKMTALSVTVGAIAVGMIGSLYGKYEGGLMSTAFGTDTVSLMFVKISLLILGLGILGFFTIKYAEKIKAKKSLSLTKDNKEDAFYTPYAAKTKNKLGDRSYVELIVLFSLIGLILILGYVSWDGVFGFEGFNTAFDKLMSFEIFKFPILAEIFGSNSYLAPFGAWGIDDLSVVLMLSTAFIAITYKLKLNEVFDSFYEGAKKVLPAGLVVILINSILVIGANTYLFVTLSKWLLQITEGSLNLLTMIPTAIINSAGYVQLQYVLGFTIDIVNNYVAADADFGLIGLIFQTMYGTVLLFAPTSMILIAGLAYTRVPYTKWFKYIWKILLALFGLSLIMIILTAIL